MVIRKNIMKLFLLSMVMGSSFSLAAQQSWFIDGYHGGIWGHYPKGYTGFIVEQMRRHPDWKINLEIEPVTWDAVRGDDTAAYRELKVLMDADKRIEYVNPAFGQSYLFMGSGESMIRQFSYGIKKLREHFPGIGFKTYSTEEPCFTSALPQVLQSFGFKYASLKNPNTCWGGYTRAQGGELVNWIGPDGSSILTVPRYATEELVKGSTWQTTAWNSGREYVQAALQYGVKHPVGMCLQDAGWRNGPWIGNRKDVQYTTWKNYFEHIADHGLANDWKVSQEDILVSLVWGSQVLQRIAQQVRKAEDKIVATEKLAAMATVRAGFVWPQAAFDRAWENLLLAQHHDCWIVPYNGKRGDTWADKVRNWTSTAVQICDSINVAALQALTQPGTKQFAVFNTAGIDRQELISIPVMENATIHAVQAGNKLLPVQRITNDKNGKQELLFKAAVAAAGSQTYQFSNRKPAPAKGASAVQRNGVVILETDLYRITIDPEAGGAVTSLISKQWNKEWIANSGSSFNTLQGNFYNDGGRISTASQKLRVDITEEGPLRVKATITGLLAGNNFVQTIALTQDEPRIDCSLQIDWQKNMAIGSNYKQQDYKAEEYRKAFYEDRQKLLLTFPLDLKKQSIHKNAPFDVTASRLNNTFFTSWDSIKNNVILHWVDITDEKEKYGMALFSDHTGAYVHGEDHPLGLVVQYSGRGLWGMDYKLDGPTHLKYSLLPHKGSWASAQLETERIKLAEPLLVSNGAAASFNSFVQFSKPGWELSSMTIDGKDLLLRLYNAAASDTTVAVNLSVPIGKSTLENLDGSRIKTIQIKKQAENGASFIVTAPRFGLRTIRLHNLVK
jgi:alpha-mannosidase